MRIEKFVSHAARQKMVITSSLSCIPLCVGRIDVRQGSEPGRKWDWQVRGWGRSPSHWRYSGCSNWEALPILFGRLPAVATTTCRNCCFRLCRNKRTVMISNDSDVYFSFVVINIAYIGAMSNCNFFKILVTYNCSMRIVISILDRWVVHTYRRLCKIEGCRELFASRNSVTAL